MLRFSLPLFLLLHLSFPDGMAVDGAKVLVVLVDGFSAYHLHNKDLALPGLRRIIKEGVWAKQQRSEFPTLSYPNHYSLMTGRHVESHGMVGNYMYDPDRNTTFQQGRSPIYNQSYWWDGAEPLWTTAVKQGKRVYIYDWEHCEIKRDNVLPNFCQKYRGTYPLSRLPETFDHAISHFVGIDKADFVGVYFSTFDHISHENGPKSDVALHIAEELDKAFVHLLEGIDRLGLRNEINLIVTSDHGMMESYKENVYALRDYGVIEEDIKVLQDYGAWTMIWPQNETHQNTLVDKLKNVPNTTVYLKEEIPAEWHYRDHYRIPPIILTSNDRSFIDTYPFDKFTPDLKYNQRGKFPKNHDVYGMHGWNNSWPEMHGIFLGRGPDLKVGHTVELSYLRDNYLLMAHLLGVQPEPHNCTWENVKRLLQERSSASGLKLGWGWIAGVVVLLLTNNSGHWTCD